MNTDIQIAQKAILNPIENVAKKLSIDEKYIEYYGKDIAKISLEINETLKDKPNGKLILVTAINPTKAGEGKSTTTIGLVDGLAKINKNVMGTLREPSMGPVFGIKGGATGGGYAQVVPMEKINLHFTGDMHAITSVNNLISAIIDNSIYHGNPLNINPNEITWKRCVDLNDRALRQVTVAQGGKNGVERKDGFNITVASEIMAIFCLSKSLDDFKDKVENVIVAKDYNGCYITIKDLNISGALQLLLKEAIKPNLVQTLENNPVFVHGGPFANIAHGCNSIIATQMALKLADYVVTEAGFGADLGAEKFLNIKCRQMGISANAVVIVATIRALKQHGGVLYEDLKIENTDAVFLGIENLKQHIENIKSYNIPFVIAINKFSQDSEEELNVVLKWCKENNITATLCEGWANGGSGMTHLAEEVVKLCDVDNKFTNTYKLTDSIEEKINKVTTKIYGGKDVIFSEGAQEKLNAYKKNGWDKLPICMVKTPVSLSDNAKLVGRPKEFSIHVNDLSISLGAGFIVVYTGSILTMPGLAKVPAAENMGIDKDGQTYGLF